MRLEIESKGARLRADRIATAVAGTRPGVIVIHDGGGYGEHAIGVAEELASAGYVALAVDLFSRTLPPANASNPELLAFLRSVPDAQIVADIQSAIDFLSADPAVAGAPIGLIGYCWGGASSFLASHHCRGLAGVVSWYGELRTEVLNALHPEHPVDAVAARRCPVLALFGELDQYVPMAYVDELRARAPKNPTPIEIVVYPGLHHGFAHRRRDHFDRAGHDDGWARIDAFFGRHLPRD